MMSWNTTNFSSGVRTLHLGKSVRVVASMKSFHRDMAYNSCHYLGLLGKDLASGYNHSNTEGLKLIPRAKVLPRSNFILQL